ncbi:hypothetical protein PQR75_22950 [Paraburkholderia fungorum]|jgi:hypothetical protein|uniref:hypothetical protein n=1 Tax=Paraburkholderia fungorum TaxID=134537 RepID=UPI0038BA6208
MDTFGGLAGGVAHAASIDAVMIAKLACEIFLSMDITLSEAPRMAVAGENHYNAMTVLGIECNQTERTQSQ